MLTFTLRYGTLSCDTIVPLACGDVLQQLIFVIFIQFSVVSAINPIFLHYEHSHQTSTKKELQPCTITFSSSNSSTVNSTSSEIPCIMKDPIKPGLMVIIVLLSLILLIMIVKLITPLVVRHKLRDIFLKFSVDKSKPSTEIVSQEIQKSIPLSSSSSESEEIHPESVDQLHSSGNASRLFKKKNSKVTIAIPETEFQSYQTAVAEPLTRFSTPLQSTNNSIVDV